MKPKSTIREETKESTKLYQADQAQGSGYFRPQDPTKVPSSDVTAPAVPGSKPARDQTRKPE